MGKRSFAARLQQLFSAHDMTLGAPWKRILEFAIPMLIGNLAQQLYNTADSIIVGRYVGDNALAAVGSASPHPQPSACAFCGRLHRRRHPGSTALRRKRSIVAPLLSMIGM